MFNDFIDASHLIEIPMGGIKFTRISDDGLKYSKIDRFLVSESCLATWNGISACTLDREYSDHCPVMLKNSDNDFGPRPTRNFNNWFDDGKSDDLIKELKKFKEVLKEKCNPEFNSLNVEIDTLLKEATKWDGLVGTRDLTYAEIASWLDSRKKWFQKDKEKAYILKQKARIKWVTDEDENSKYFHSCIKRRQNKNNIRGINSNGLWTENPGEIKAAAFTYFQNRFSV
ncbi:uncharacterized protein [Rutidosis leptorrhynchoides]|uniref:uncharacterized protein n=1 Tax=Rutidosis leptorrhynchoides TaxID=125765 RepID=UPI003A9901F1